MSNVGHTPQRTCLGCRAKKDKIDLIRCVLIERDVRVDPENTLPGRGAYLCANEGCLQTAIQRKAFSRAFKRDVRLDAGRLMKEFSECLKKK